MADIPVTETGAIDFESCALGLFVAARNGDLASAECALPQLAHDLAAMCDYAINRCAEVAENGNVRNQIIANHIRNLMSGERTLDETDGCSATTSTDKRNGVTITD